MFFLRSAGGPPCPPGASCTVAGWVPGTRRGKKFAPAHPAALELPPRRQRGQYVGAAVDHQAEKSEENAPNRGFGLGL
jgi:hypothetical protein